VAKLWLRLVISHSWTLLVGLLRNFVRLGVWPMEICSTNLLNYDYGVQRCPAATCIIPLLMQLFFIVAVWMQRHIIYCMFFCGSRRQQNRLTLAADILEKGRRKRTKFSRLLEGRLSYTMTQTGDPWSRGSPREPIY